MRFFYVLQVDLTLGRVILYFKFKVFADIFLNSKLLKLQKKV